MRDKNTSIIYQYHSLPMSNHASSPLKWQDQSTTTVPFLEPKLLYSAKWVTRHAGEPKDSAQRGANSQQVYISLTLKTNDQWPNKLMYPWFIEQCHTWSWLGNPKPAKHRPTYWIPKADQRIPAWSATNSSPPWQLLNFQNRLPQHRHYEA
jgi:hypothetical protein